MTIIKSVLITIASIFLLSGCNEKETEYCPDGLCKLLADDTVCLVERDKFVRAYYANNLHETDKKLFNKAMSNEKYIKCLESEFKNTSILPQISLLTTSTLHMNTVELSKLKKLTDSIDGVIVKKASTYLYLVNELASIDKASVESDSQYMLYWRYITYKDESALQALVSKYEKGEITDVKIMFVLISDYSKSRTNGMERMLLYSFALSDYEEKKKTRSSLYDGFATIKGSHDMPMYITLLQSLATETFQRKELGKTYFYMKVLQYAEDKYVSHSTFFEEFEKSNPLQAKRIQKTSKKFFEDFKQNRLAYEDINNIYLGKATL